MLMNLISDIFGKELSISQISTEQILVILFGLTLIILIRYFRTYYRDLADFIETKEFFNNIMQSSADAIIASDNKSRITYFSRGAENLFERKAREMMNKNVLDLFPENYFKKGEFGIENSDRDFTEAMNLTITTPTEKQKIISLDLSKLKDAEGRTRGTVGIAKDITEEIRKNNQIRYLKELSEKVIEGSPEGIVLFDAEHKFTLINKSFEKIAEIEKNKLIGTDALKNIEIRQLKKIFEAMNLEKKLIDSAHMKEPIAPDEFTFEMGGKNRTLTSFITPLYGSKGEVEFVLLILHDITKRKVLEEDLKEQMKLLKHSNELKDMFTDIIRHDILNPVGVIKNYGDLIMDGPLEPMVKEGISAMTRNAEKAIDMIENASELAKLEDSEGIKFEKMDLGKIAHEVIKSLEGRARKNEISVSLIAKGKYPAIVNTSIEHVFLNLISNAIKYGPDKSNIFVGIKSKKENWLVFVKDNGEGVEDEYKESIFNRFTRVKREGVKGTGLGLAIAKRIVGIHKGSIWVEDNPEGGSIFYFEIPKNLAE